MVVLNSRRHISASQLDTFCKCPEQWRRRYVENEIIPPGIALLKGKGVHKAAEVNFRQKIKSHEDLPPAELMAAADAAFTAEIAGGFLLTEEESAAGRENVLGTARDETVKMAEFHANEQAPDYQPLLVEQPFRVELPGTRDLIGVIDMADDKCRVTDLKTAKKSKTQADADGSVQLTCYEVGHRVLLGEPPRELRLDTIVQGKKGFSRNVVSTSRDAGDLDALANRINIVTQSIDAGLFPPAPPGAWWCGPKWCGYWTTCPYVNGQRKAAAEGSE